MIIISNAQRDSLVRILERLETIEMPRTLRNTEMLRQAGSLRRALNCRPKIVCKDFNEELLQKVRKIM